jgi:Protein of unknown function (DUF3040)
MALSMDEQRMLAEIERRLADDDPVLAARLTSFRLPRLTLATRSARSRLTTSLLMLVVVGVVAVFVYALVPFRGQQAKLGGGHPAAPRSVASSISRGTTPVFRQGSSAQAPAQLMGPAMARSGSSAAYGR